MSFSHAVVGTERALSDIGMAPNPHWRNIRTAAEADASAAACDLLGLLRRLRRESDRGWGETPLLNFISAKNHPDISQPLEQLRLIVAQLEESRPAPETQPDGPLPEGFCFILEGIHRDFGRAVL
jgi:hypothetical protein